MSIETKLREGSDAIKQATRPADFSSRSPSQERGRFNGPLFAWVGGLVVVALLAVPALLAGVGGQSNSDGWAGSAPAGDEQSAVSSAEPTSQTEINQVTTTVVFAEDGQAAEEIDAPKDFPFLFIRSAGWTPTYAQAISSDAGDGGFAAEINYEYMTEDETGGVISLRIQQEGMSFERFAEMEALAVSQESLTIDSRPMTLYHVPREAIPEDADSDAHLVTWEEGTNAQGFVIAFGVEQQELVEALAGLEAMPAEAWQELATVHSEAYQASTIPTTTTVTDASDAP